MTVNVDGGGGGSSSVFKPFCVICIHSPNNFAQTSSWNSFQGRSKKAPLNWRDPVALNIPSYVLSVWGLFDSHPLFVLFKTIFCAA